MATVNGVVGTQTITGKTVTDGRHPAVIRIMEFASDAGTIQAGEIIALDASGKAVSFDPAASDSTNTPVGVCTEDIDTSKDTAGSVAVHGTVMKKSLLTKGSASSAAHVASLETNAPIWVF
ncbi:hypothetical protein [Seleniivibrio sp.]|uniref:hypothetical protein n=1 Tax=Seleniivibrio sp. TaxID=2898801 RepID=UPI0025E43146|nr:hypothetical protein [Seleniivibrio sp.]MCD8552327.1 hypothetical protein [Seleniivibrio sp.]